MSVNIGVVGLGIGARHLKSLAGIPVANIAAIADLDVDKRQQSAAEYGANAYSDWRAMLDGEPDLDAVILATPAVVRREPIAAIAERKLALFCEKPPAVNLQEAMKISRIITGAGILNTVGFMYRWSPLANQFRDIVSQRPRLFARGVVAWPVFGWVQDGRAPRSLYSKAACGGPLIEQAIHFQDALRYITGDEPLAVQACAELGHIAPREGRDCEETTAYILRHQSGMLSTHVHNWTHQGGLLQLQVVGEKFDLTWNLTGNAMQLSGTLDGASIDEKSDADCYFEEMVGFIAAVEQGDQSLLRSPYADACRSMAVCEAGAEAVISGRLTEVRI